MYGIIDATFLSCLIELDANKITHNVNLVIVSTADVLDKDASVTTLWLDGNSLKV